MRLATHNFRDFPMRFVAGLIALLCLWMGTGAVLHHTDEFETAFFLVGRAALHQATPAAHADACAACEWTQGLQTHSPGLPQLVVSLDSLPTHDARLVRDAFTRPTRHSSPRAPPSFLV